MIITGGFNVYSAGVEQCLMTHPAVQEACVFGIPDDKWGEAVHAVVVPRAAVLGEMGDLFVFRQVTTAPFAYERTPVVVGLRGARDIEIIEGVLPGDRVVTRGNYPLQFVGVGAQKLEDDHGHSHGPGGHKH